MYRTYNARPLPRRSLPRRSRGPILWCGIIVVVAILYACYALLRPLPAPKAVILPPVMPALVRVNVPWTATAPGEEQAYGAVGYGFLAQNNPGQPEKPQPTASIAKVITALAVLEKRPLVPGEQGPKLTLTQHDVDLYDQYAVKDGSVVPVTAGETITEYQALQAMMLPSANNIADTLAEWAFGSLPAYTEYANGFVRKIGMTNTTVADASGFSSDTVSTAADLVRLGQAAMNNPALSEIIAQPEADFPEYGTMQNVNLLLGQSGIRGIKTGNTDEAGGCYLTAADVMVGGRKITVIAAVLHAANLSQAMKSTLPLIQATPSLFQTVHVVSRGQAVGTVTTAWGDRSNVTATSGITVTTWSGTAIAPKVSTARVPARAPAGTNAGKLTLDIDGTHQAIDLDLAQPLSAPSILWRLEHPF